MMSDTGVGGKPAPLRVAIVGCGVIAPTHADCFRRIPGVELVWACDVVPERAARLAEAHSIPLQTTDYLQIMRDKTVDAVSVCTDHASHVPIVISALEHQKHVLCEKALVADYAGLDAMFAAQKLHPEVVFSAVSQHRFDPVNQQVRALVGQGVLGQLLTASVQLQCHRAPGYYEADAWRGTWQYEGGSALINQAIHFIDVLVWTMGGVQAVCGMHENLTHGRSIETEDTAVAVLRFRNGALGTVQVTTSSFLSWEHTFSYSGTEGCLDIRDGVPLRAAFRDSTTGEDVMASLGACRNVPALAAGKAYYGGGHTGQIADFVAAIQESRDPFIAAMDFRHTVDVVLGIYRSVRERRWVEIGVQDEC